MGKETTIEQAYKAIEKTERRLMASFRDPNIDLIELRENAELCAVVVAIKSELIYTLTFSTESESLYQKTTLSAMQIAVVEYCLGETNE